jgi:fructuronate reductase
LAGAQLVADVRPYEHVKLRLLNGAHSALAYLGYLGGYETIADTMDNPHYRAFVQTFMSTEIASTLSAPAGMDLADYQNELVRRFCNAGIRHRTWQIAMDGSQKLPQRLLGTIRDRLATGRTIECAALAVAAWIRYVGGHDESGVDIDVRDPLAVDLQRAFAGGQGDPERIVASVVQMHSIFGDDLPGNHEFVSSVSSALRSLLHLGARGTVAMFVDRLQQARSK